MQVRRREKLDFPSLERVNERSALSLGEIGMGICSGGLLPFLSILIGSSCYSPQPVLEEVIAVVEKNYLYEGGGKCIRRVGIENIEQCLDEHSWFATINDRLANTAPVSEFSYGIMNLRSSDGMIVGIFPMSSAEEVDLRTNDFVEKAGKAIFAPSNPKRLKDALICRESGEKLRVLIRRGKTKLEKELECRPFPRGSVSINTGLSVYYLRIHSFLDEGLVAKLNRITKDFSSGGYEGLVIDLRDNLGGYAYLAESLLLQFTKDGDTIFSLAGRGGKVLTVATTVSRFSFGTEGMKPGRGALHGVPTVILVNEHTASASEFFAGAMQELGYALVVGRRTFGKGVGQSTYELRDGSALHLTDLEYLLGPRAKKLHGIGVFPDVVFASDDGVSPSEERASATGWAYRWARWSRAHACLLDQLESSPRF